MEREKRIFFRRKALMTLRQYWLSRWDSLLLREHLSLKYKPKYYLEYECLDGCYLKIRGIDLLWYKGAFSQGIHLPNGRYYPAPFHFSNVGLGPRELVFPLSLIEQAHDLTLIGDWTRYQRCFHEVESTSPFTPPNKKAHERLRVSVERFGFAQPRAVLDRWGFGRAVSAQTLCIHGVANNSPHEGCPIVVPLREIYWKGLATAA